MSKAELDATAAKTVQLMPAGRFASPDDVATGVAYLASRTSWVQDSRHRRLAQLLAPTYATRVRCGAPVAHRLKRSAMTILIFVVIVTPAHLAVPISIDPVAVLISIRPVSVVTMAGR